MGDPDSVGKLSEILRDHYAEQLDDQPYSHIRCNRNQFIFKAWPCSVLWTLRSEFFLTESGLSIGRNVKTWYDIFYHQPFLKDHVSHGYRNLRSMRPVSPSWSRYRNHFRKTNAILLFWLQAGL